MVFGAGQRQPTKKNKGKRQGGLTKAEIEAREKAVEKRPKGEGTSASVSVECEGVEGKAEVKAKDWSARSHQGDQGMELFKQ